MQQEIESTQLHSLYCPISGQLFNDPVKAEDGQTYERESITKWLQTKPCSPITQSPMGFKLVSDQEKLVAIAELLVAQPQLKAKQFQPQASVAPFAGIMPGSEQTLPQPKTIELKSECKDRQILELLEDLNAMPLSAERTLLILQTATLLLQNNIKEWLEGAETQQLSSVIDNEFNYLQNCKTLNSNQRSKVQTIQADVRRADWPSAAKKIYTLLSEIRPFNIPELLRLVAKSRDAADSINGQDVLLFVGPTGAGKSTLIQFLFGSKMAKVKQAGLDHITAVEHRSPAIAKLLEDVTSSPEQRSETRYVRAVPLNFRDIGWNSREGGILVCDTPGFGDTRGAELDIANGIGLVNAIRTAKSVKFAVLINYKDAGEKSQHLKELAHLLVGIMTNLKSYLDNIAFVFTKYPDEEFAQLHAKFTNVKQNLAANELEDESFMALFNSLLDSLEFGDKRILRFNPLQDNYLHLLRSFTQLQEIRHPEEVFQFSITDKSRELLKEQIVMHRDNITRALANSEYTVIKYLLDQLLQLHELLHLDFIKLTYDHCVESIKSHLQHCFQTAVANFDKLLNPEQYMSEADLQEYLQAVHNIGLSEVVRDSHLNQETVQSAGLTQHVHTSMVQTVAVIGSFATDAQAYQKQMTKLKLVATYFPSVKALYQTQKDKLAAEIQNIFTEIEQEITTYCWSEIAKHFATIQLMTKELRDHLDSDKIRARRYDITEQLIRQVQKEVDAIVDLPNDRLAQLQSADLEKLQNLLKTVNEAKVTSSLEAYLGLKVIERWHNALIEKLMACYQTKEQEITSLFNAKQELAFEPMEKLVSELTTLHNFSAITAKTSESYYKLIESIIGFLKETRRDCEAQLKVFLEGDVSGCDKFAKSLSLLKRVSWLEQYKPGVIQETLQEVRERTLSYLNTEKQSAMAKELSLEQSNGIDEMVAIIKKFDTLQALEMSLPEITPLRLELKANFESTLKTIFCQIRSVFNVDSISLHELLQVQEKYQALLDELRQKNLQLAYNLLTSEQIDNALVLENELIQLQSRAAEVSKRIESICSAAEQHKQECNRIGNMLSQYNNIIAPADTAARKAAQQYLSTRGYQDISSLLEEDATAKQQQTKYQTAIAEQQQLLQQINERQAKLTLLKNQYEDHVKQAEASALIAANELLVNAGFASTETLSEEINILTTRVKQDTDSRFRGIDNLNDLDINLAEKAYQFLHACKAIKDLQQEHALTQQIFVNMLKKYAKTMADRINTLFNTIRHASIEASDAQNAKNSQELLALLRQFNHIKEHCPRCFTLFSTTLLDQFKAQLEECKAELADEMLVMQGSRNTQGLKTKLGVAKALSRFDFLVDGEKFTDIFVRYREAFFAETKISAEILRAIKELSCADIADHFSKLSNLNDQVSVNNLNTLNDTLSRTLLGFCEDTKTTTIMVGGTIDQNTLKTVKILVDNLNKIKEVQTLLQTYLKAPIVEQLQETIAFVKSSISQLVIKFLDAIEASLDMNNFLDCDIRMELVGQIRTLLGSYCTQEIVSKLDNLRARISSVLDNVVQKYTALTLVDYPIYPPKDICEKLHQVCGRDQNYGQALSKIKDVIFQKCRDELGLARACALPAERNPHIRVVDTATRFITAEYRAALMVELDNLKEDIAGTVAENKSRVEQLIKLDDVVGLQIHLDSNASNAETHRQLRNMVTDIILNYRKKIDEKMENEEIYDILPELRKIFEYKLRLGEHLPIVQSYYTQIKQKINAVVENIIRIIEAQLSDDLSMGVLDSSRNLELMEAALDNLTNFISLDEDIRRFSSVSALSDARTSSPMAKHHDISIEAAEVSLFDEELYEKLKGMNTKLLNYFGGLNEQITAELANQSWHKLNHSLDIAKIWEKVITKLKKYLNAVRPKTDTIQHIYKAASSIAYDQITDAARHSIKDIIQYFDRLDISLTFRAKIGEKEQLLFMEEVDKKLKLLCETDVLSRHLDCKGFSIVKLREACVNALTNKINEIVTSATKIINKRNLDKRDFLQINHQYHTLSSLAKQVSSLKIIRINLSDKLTQLDNVIIERVANLESRVASAAELKQKADLIVEIKCLAEGIINFKKVIDARIDDILNGLKRVRGGGQIIAKLGTMFNMEPTGIGQIILAEHKCFIGYAVHIFNTKTQAHGIEYVLENIRGESLDKAKLRSRYNDFKECYDNLIKRYLAKDVNYDSLIASLKIKIQNVKVENGKAKWNATVKDALPDMLAHIFALWTLINSAHYYDAEGTEDQQSYLLVPHAAQVISIFRMLGVDDHKTDFINNFVQIGTGQGKSITLAATASVLALFGFEVNCACYSKYLSERDYSAFQAMFETLGVLDRIHYGTFNSLCEDIINEDGKVRDLVTQLVSTGAITSAAGKAKLKRPKILLVDEVDVFFNKEFYASVYTPSAKLTDPTICNLADFIWQHKDTITFGQLLRTAQYKECLERYKGWEFLITEAAKDMISDVKSYFSHQYVVKEDQIGYKEQDSIVFNMVYGYKTLFAYYHENQHGKISEKSLRDHTSINIQCGNFSYAEVPMAFVAIMGVTGTLETLSRTELDIIEESYNIRKKTFAPSVYGANNLLFSENADIKIETEVDYYNAIKREIDDRLVGKTADGHRSVLVFFENKDKLLAFYHSPVLAACKDEFSIITEEINDSEKVALIKRATTANQVTLLTKSFGRGTDFICRDQVVSANGGVHVIQSYLSEAISEEVQIKGRTARQGEQGSYSMVLLDKSLEVFLISAADITRIKQNKTYYSELNDKRNKYFEQQYSEDIRAVAQIRLEHLSAMRFVQSLLKRDLGFVVEYLGERNKGADLKKRTRTVLLMDTTGSMSHLIQKAKNTIGTMFTRAAEIFVENGFPEDSSEMQCVGYKNYDRKEDELLQVSPWETDAGNLRKFIEGLQASGGTWMEEAIEIGLWHANREADDGGVDQVILIGDAPANRPEQVTEGRAKRHGEKYWQTTKFAVPTTCDQEVNRLVERGIPVQCFYVANAAKSQFELIAKRTNGRCQFLDVNSSAGAEDLTNVVTEEVLRIAGQSAGRGNDLVEAYRSKYGKSYI